VAVQGQVLNLLEELPAGARRSLFSWKNFRLARGDLCSQRLRDDLMGYLGESVLDLANAL
jgi:hypothetical protein